MRRVTSTSKVCGLAKATGAAAIPPPSSFAAEKVRAGGQATHGGENWASWTVAACDWACGTQHFPTFAIGIA